MCGRVSAPPITAHLAADDDVAARGVHGEPLVGGLARPRLLEHALLGQEAVHQLGVAVVVQVLCNTAVSVVMANITQ